MCPIPFAEECTDIWTPTEISTPTFTSEHLEEAQRLAACHQAPYVQVQRAKMALILAEHPDVSNPDLGHQVDAHPNTVFKWRKDWTLHGFHLDDHPRSGRPTLFPPGADRRDQSRRL